MSKYLIEIDDEAVKKQIHNIVAELLNEELKYKGTPTHKVVAEAVKDIVYSQKDEIIDKVVNKASREIVKKGFPKLIEKWSEE